MTKWYEATNESMYVVEFYDNVLVQKARRKSKVIFAFTITGEETNVDIDDKTEFVGSLVHAVYYDENLAKFVEDEDAEEYSVNVSETDDLATFYTDSAILRGDIFYVAATTDEDFFEFAKRAAVLLEDLLLNVENRQPESGIDAWCVISANSKEDAHKKVSRDVTMKDSYDPSISEKIGLLEPVLQSRPGMKKLFSVYEIGETPTFIADYSTAVDAAVFRNDNFVVGLKARGPKHVFYADSIAEADVVVRSFFHEHMSYAWNSEQLTAAIREVIQLYASGKRDGIYLAAKKRTKHPETLQLARMRDAQFAKSLDTFVRGEISVRSESSGVSKRLVICPAGWKFVRTAIKKADEFER